MNPFEFQDTFTPFETVGYQSPQTESFNFPPLLELNPLPKLKKAEDFGFHSNAYPNSSVYSNSSNNQKSSISPISSFADKFNASFDSGPKLNESNYVFTYSPILDKRYDKEVRFDPRQNTEEIYANNQSQWDAFKIQLDRANDTFWSTAKSIYRGKANTYKNTIQGDFKGAYNAFLDDFQNYNDFAESMRKQEENPIYGEDKDFWSFKGGFGDAIASRGFMGAVMTTSLLDTVGGQAIKRLAGTGIGNVVLGGIAIGALGLASEQGQDLVGKETADITLGMILGSAESSLIIGGIDKLTKTKDAITKSKALYETIKQAKTSKELLKNTSNYFTQKFIGETVLDTASTLGKQAKISNTINKGLKFTSGFGKQYIQHGSEAALEAIGAQSEYVRERLESNETKDDAFYIDLKDKTRRIGQDVYDLNRILLGATSFIQYGDIVMGTSIKNIVKNSGVELIKGQWKPKGYVKKAIIEGIKDNAIEGFEEVAQLGITKGILDYHKQNEAEASKMVALSKAVESVWSTEGLHAFLSGFVSGNMVGAFKAAYNVPVGLKEGKSFSESLFQYDKSYQEKLAKVLNDNSGTISKILKQSADFKNASVEEKEELANQLLFNHVVSGIELGTFSANMDNLNQVFSSKEGTDEHNHLIQLYKDQKGIEKAKQDISKKINLAKTSIDHFTTYFNNPYTTTVIEELVSKVRPSTKEQNYEQKQKAKLFNDLVRLSALSLYTNQLTIKEIKEVTNEVKTSFKTEHYDYSDYLLMENGWELFKQTVKEDLSILQQANKELNIDPKKEKELKAIQDEVDYFEENFKNLKEKGLPFAGNLPLLQFMSKRTNKADINTLVKLEKLQNLNKVLLFTSHDLKSFTTQDQQKKVIDHLWSINKSFERISETKAQKILSEPPTLTKVLSETVNKTKPQTGNTAPSPFNSNLIRTECL